jgi:hypothetical protein
VRRRRRGQQREGTCCEDGDGDGHGGTFALVGAVGGASGVRVSECW